MSSQSSTRGWIVTFAGTGINLALGVLYSWSVISKNIPAEWNWSEAGKAWPYTIACLVFAFTMVPAGKLQDKFGPRLVASLGGILTGVGMILASQFHTLPMFIVGFGLLAGAGIGFGYASATPAAVKWFPSAKTGLIAGVVVSGFGLASVYIAPLAEKLIVLKGVPFTMFVLGAAFLVIVVALSQLLINPPTPAAAPVKPGAAAPPTTKEFTGSEMLRTPLFYVLWVMYVFNAGAGLMIIGKLAKLVEIQAGSKAGFILVALLAVGNAGGRLLAGTLSDKLGRILVLQIFTAFQALLMFITPSMSNLYILVFISMCIGMNYGSNLALFPAMTKESFGLKNFGINYGLVFTAWGVGSLMALMAGRIYDWTKAATGTGKFDYALYLSGGMLILALLLSVIVKPMLGRIQQT